MAIDSGWDLDPGLPLPEEPPFVPPSDEQLAAWAREDAASLAHARYSWQDDELEDPLDESILDEPAWAVPGVSSTEPPVEGEVSAATQARLDDVTAAVQSMRAAGAWLYRSITALRGSDVLVETRYRKLGRLLQDHVRLDPAQVAALERHAEALHPQTTPTGATTPATLPATAAKVDAGVIGSEHVEIITRIMSRIRAVADLPVEVADTAEEQLAGLAAMLSPRQLASAAKTVADRLDPDGAAPKDDDPAGNELNYTKRRNGQVHAKLILRDPAAAALFDEAIRAATPAPASASCADPDTGLPPVTEDGQVGADPRVEARDSKPCRQATGLLDLIAGSHRAGLDHPDSEQGPGSPTGSMPLPDLDDPDDTGPDDDLPGNGAHRPR